MARSFLTFARAFFSTTLGTEGIRAVGFRMAYTETHAGARYDTLNTSLLPQRFNRALGVTTIQTSPYRTPLCGVDDVSGCTFQAAFTDKIQRRGLQFLAIFLTIAYQCVEKDKLNLWDTCDSRHGLAI